MSTVTQNWDGVTAPAMPGTWTVSNAGIVTTTTLAGGLTPTSSPNVISAPGTAFLSTQFATYGVIDDNAGSLSISANVASHGSNSPIGLFFRGNLASPTTYYLALLSFTAGQVVLRKTTTPLATVSSTFAADAWYRIVATAVANLFTVSVQRRSDSFWLNSSGSFTSTLAQCISTSDGSITGAGYFGILFNPQGLSSVLYSDDFSESGLTPPTLTPYMRVARRPLPPSVQQRVCS